MSWRLALRRSPFVYDMRRLLHHSGRLTRNDASRYDAGFANPLPHDGMKPPSRKRDGTFMLSG